MRFVRHLTTVVAVLCVLAWMPWVMGVPGDSDNDYARGWAIGLYSILAYPAAILAVAALSLALRLFGVSDATLPNALRFLALAAFLAAQVLAWSIMT